MGMKPPALKLEHLNIDVPKDLLTFTLVQANLGIDRSCGRFVMPPEQAKVQLALLAKTLKKTGDHEATFHVYPEYSLPQAHLAELDAYAEQHMLTNSILLAGLDSMPYATYHALTADAGSDIPAKHKNTWINPGVLWVREGNDKPKRFIQPKLSPANEEEAVGGMYRGNFIHVFETSNGFRFAFVICRDLIATVNPTEMGAEKEYLPASFAAWFATELKHTPLDLLIVIQFNSSPDDAKFQDAEMELLSSGAVKAILAVNHARYAKSGFYFSGLYKFPPAALPSSYSFERMAYPIYRARFRNDHSTLYVVHLQEQGHNLGEKSKLPIEPVEEYPISGGELTGSGERVGPYQWAFRAYGRLGHPLSDNPQLPIAHPFGEQYDQIYGELAGSANETALKQILDLLQCIDPPFKRTKGSTLGEPEPEPRAWDDHKAHIGDMVRTLAMLSFGGNIAIDFVNPGVTARLPWANCQVALVTGDRGKHFPTCLSEVASWLKKQKADGFSGPVVLVIQNHKGNGPDRLKAYYPPDLTSEALDRHRQQLQPLDQAPPPRGEGDGQSMLMRIDDTPEPLVWCISAGIIEDLELAEQPGVVEERLREVFRWNA